MHPLDVYQTTALCIHEHLMATYYQALGWFKHQVGLLLHHD